MTERYWMDYPRLGQCPIYDRTRGSGEPVASVVDPELASLIVDLLNEEEDVKETARRTGLEEKAP